MTETRQNPAGAEAKTAKSKLTRQDQLKKLLRRPAGVTIARIQKFFGWQPHTARAAISTLRKSGIAIERSETAKGSVYRIDREG